MYQLLPVSAAIEECTAPVSTGLDHEEDGAHFVVVHGCWAATRAVLRDDVDQGAVDDGEGRVPEHQRAQARQHPSRLILYRVTWKNII